MKKTKENKGISLISLVVTVVVLLILLTVSIAFLTGENGIINRGNSAKEETEISEEKNILKASAVSALGANNAETLQEENLEYYLDGNVGDENYILDKGIYEDSFLVTFLKDGKLGRQYIILGDGTVLESDEDYYVFKLQPNSIPSLELGSTEEITAITNMEGEITWLSSNTSVAVIEQDETTNTKVKVVAKELGTTQIVATMEQDGVSRTAICNVEVVEVNTIKVLSVELDKTNEIIDLGTENKTLQLTATINPEFANKGTELTWISSNPGVAMVDENGLVTGVTNGTAVITVKTSNNKTDTCVVTVQTTATGIELSPTTASIELNGTKTLQLNAKVLPEGANIGSEVTWSSSNTNIAIVSDTGLVTGISRGTATITAKTANGYTATCTVLCYTPITSIVVTPASATIYIGNGTYSKTVQLTATVNPSNTDEKVTWTSSNTGVATVSDTGLVTAVSTGAVTITAKNPSGNIKATSTITVKGQYTISYNANGGSGAPSSQTKAQGVNLKLSSVKPSRSNYTFQGWATSSSGSVKYQPQGTYSVDADVTLYAIWKKNSTSGGGGSGGGGGGSRTITYTGSYSNKNALSSSWIQCGSTKNLGSVYISSITGSYSMGAKDMYRDRYFEMKIEGKRGSSWYTLWSAKSSKFTWNFGQDRSFSKSVSASPRGNYTAVRCMFRYSTNIDSGGAKWANFSLTLRVS